MMIYPSQKKSLEALLGLLARDPRFGGQLTKSKNRKKEDGEKNPLVCSNKSTQRNKRGGGRGRGWLLGSITVLPSYLLETALRRRPIL